MRRFGAKYDGAQKIDVGPCIKSGHDWKNQVDPNGVALHNLTERTVLPFVRPGYEDVSASASQKRDRPIARPSSVDIGSIVARMGTLNKFDAHETAAILVSLATECIQLRASLAQEMDYQNTLLRELHDVKRTLAQARADLLSHHDDVKQQSVRALALPFSPSTV